VLARAAGQKPLGVGHPAFEFLEAALTEKLVVWEKQYVFGMDPFLGVAAPDRPDRAALTDNPLIPFGGR